MIPLSFWLLFSATKSIKSPTLKTLRVSKALIVHEDTMESSGVILFETADEEEEDDDDAIVIIFLWMVFIFSLKKFRKTSNKISGRKNKTNNNDLDVIKIKTKPALQE